MHKICLTTWTSSLALTNNQNRNKFVNTLFEKSEEIKPLVMVGKEQNVVQKVERKITKKSTIPLSWNILLYANFIHADGTSEIPVVNI